MDFEKELRINEESEAFSLSFVPDGIHCDGKLYTDITYYSRCKCLGKHFILLPADVSNTDTKLIRAYKCRIKKAGEKIAFEDVVAMIIKHLKKVR